MDLASCKYCWLYQSELQSSLVCPCACTNPICEECFETHLNNKKDNKCEICLKPYQHHLLNLYIDPVKWTIMNISRIMSWAVLLLMLSLILLYVPIN